VTKSARKGEAIKDNGRWRRVHFIIFSPFFEAIVDPKIVEF